MIIVETARDVAGYAAKLMIKQLSQKPDSVLGLATGSTPLGLYQRLVELYRRDKVSFQEVTTFNLDEYVGLLGSSTNSYQWFMRQKLFKHIDVDLQNTHIPSCEPGQDPFCIAKQYEAQIIRAGGIDLQILGIGANGHIGFNEPSSSLASRTRVKTLTQSTIDQNSKWFGDQEPQPYLAITMGIGTIMDADRVLLMAIGKNKAKAVAKMVEGPVSAACPASVLQHHQQVNIVVDAAAASELKNTEYYHWSYQQNQRLSKKYDVYNWV